MLMLMGAGASALGIAAFMSGSMQKRDMKKAMMKAAEKILP
jgi:hypothetical protein